MTFSFFPFSHLRALLSPRTPLVACALASFYCAGTVRADVQHSSHTNSHNTNGKAISFSPEQVSLGAQIYAGACAVCHGAVLEGGHDVPDLGNYFTARWANTPLDQLTGYISRAMPLMAPGTLSAQETTALVAFLLRQNGVNSTGNTPLPADASQLAKFRFPTPASLSPGKN